MTTTAKGCIECGALGRVEVVGIHRTLVAVREIVFATVADGCAVYEVAAEVAGVFGLGVAVGTETIGFVDTPNVSALAYASSTHGHRSLIEVAVGSKVELDVEVDVGEV